MFEHSKGFATPSNAMIATEIAMAMIAPDADHVRIR
jgi:hypothetical protein